MTYIESPESRLSNIDMLKAFGIFMVLIGHQTNNLILEQYIYSFHMPLFFWISGFLFNPEKYRRFNIFLLKRFQTVIMPYFIFASISFVFWFFIVRGLSVRGQVYSLDPWYPFFGIFVGIGVEPWRNPLDIALWFLPCLFVTEIIYWFVNKYKKTRRMYLVLSVIGLIGYISSIWSPYRLPWSIDTAATAVIFYCVGHRYRNLEMDIRKIHLIWKIMVIAAFAILGFGLGMLNGKADMNYNHYGNPLLFYCGAFAGIYLWYYIISACPINRLVTFIGKNTIILVGLLGISTFILRGLHYLLFGTLGSIGKSGIISTVIYCTFSICMLIPVMYLINRFCPFILGRTNQNKFIAQSL